MFLKCRTRYKEGKKHRSWSVVETRRYRGGKVAHRQVFARSERTVTRSHSRTAPRKSGSPAANMRRTVEPGVLILSRLGPYSSDRSRYARPGDIATGFAVLRRFAETLQPGFTTDQPEDTRFHFLQQRVVFTPGDSWDCGILRRLADCHSGSSRLSEEPEPTDGIANPSAH